MPKVKRSELLAKLEQLQPGLSTRDVVEQSASFVFKDGFAMTYNDEVACRIISDLDLEGAVKAAPLLNLLRKLSEDEIDITVVKDQLRVTGKNKQADLAMDTEVLLPFDNVEVPKKWDELDENFIDGIKLVQGCAGTDVSQHAMTCVHITPKFVEASDNMQITRFSVPTPTKKPILVRRDAIKNITTTLMSQICQTANWVHFQSSEGLIMSCRRYAEDYPDFTAILKKKGDKATLPKGLEQAADIAQVFSSDAAEDDAITIDLRKNKMRVVGKGVTGTYRETKPVKYTGENMSFRISPTLLTEIVKRSTNCEISESALKVSNGRFVFMASLAKA